MRVERDAYGQAMLDHLEGRRSSSVVIERDDGWVDVDLGVEMYFAPRSRWPKAERRVLRAVRGRVLDIGCGAGRVALDLQARGHDVTGIDVAPLAVEVCRRRGLRDARVLSIGRAGPSLGTFDTVLLLGHNIGLLADEAQARRALERLHRITTDGARIIGSNRNPHDTTDPGHRAYHRRNRSRGRLPGQIRMRIRYRTIIGPWFDYLFVSPRELERLVRGTGWQVSTVERDGPNYAAVIEKSRPRPSRRRVAFRIDHDRDAVGYHRGRRVPHDVQ
jgi:SAM-dependent methyltransferase